MATPAVPSALRPNAPPSELKVPGRLVTTTAAGEGAAAAASPLPPLAVPEAVSGTADPFWRALLQHIEGADGSHEGASPAGQPPQFLAAFQPEPLARLVAAMPAGVLTALVHGLAAPGTPAPSRAAYLACLEGAARALAAAEQEVAGDNLSASQQLWQPRGAPVAASLAELCREPQLVAGLCAAAEGGHGQGAPAAAAVAQLLLASEAGRAAAAAAEGSLLADLEGLAATA